MDRVFSGLEFVRYYIDDIIVFSTSKKKHRVHLTEVFARLRLHDLKLHPSKCRFYYDRVEYLGHMIYLRGLGVVASKVEVVMSISKPRDVSRLRVFLGLCNYYRKFVKTFSAIAKQGCHNGRFWMKITVRTSAHVCVYQQTRFYLRMGFYRPRTR
jgi:hypothetical protein